MIAVQRYYFSYLCGVITFTLFLIIPFFYRRQSTELIYKSTILSDKSNNLPVFNDHGSVKHILLWNGYDRIEMNIFLHIFLNDSCPVNNCRVTSQHQYPLSKFDAIIFNGAVIDHLETDKMPPSSERRSAQRYIFLSQESPYYNSKSIESYVGFFNWTMSYLPDSDIKYSYGRVESSKNVLVPHEQNRYKKSKLIAWFVSHCSTQSWREKYVQELQKYVAVDVYGLCGSLKCGWNQTRGISQPECYEMLEEEYKFYLSFENSLCHHYVTEKFYSILQLDVVPVVFGAENYSAIAPPQSFIDATNYSPKELANILLIIDSNDTLYQRYFDWKTNYVIHSGYEEMGREALCSLCVKLNQDNLTHEIAEVSSAWDPAFRCLNPRYLKAFRHATGIQYQ